MGRWEHPQRTGRANAVTLPATVVWSRHALRRLAERVGPQAHGPTLLGQARFLGRWRRYYVWGTEAWVFLLGRGGSGSGSLVVVSVWPRRYYRRALAREEAAERAVSGMWEDSE